jgi:hypothetical protein
MKFPSLIGFWQSLQMVVRTRGAPQETKKRNSEPDRRGHREQMVVATRGKLETWLQEEPVWA